jgi:hypothetical protein
MTTPKLLAALLATFVSASLLVTAPAQACGYSPFDFPVSTSQVASAAVGNALGQFTTKVTSVLVAADQQSAVVFAYDRRLNRHVVVQVKAGATADEAWSITATDVVHGAADDIARVLRKWNRNAAVSQVFFNGDDASVRGTLGDDKDQTFTVQVRKNRFGNWQIRSTKLD